MMIGTSVGGIIALCLAINIDINDVSDIFIEMSNKIFNNKKTFLRKLFESNYDGN